MADIGQLVGKVVIDTAGGISSLVAVEQQSKNTQASFDKLALVGTAVFAGLSLAITSFATDAASELDVATAFARNFSDQTGQGLEKLRAVTKGTVDDFDLMKVANRAALEGVTSDVNQLAGILQVARQRSKDLGQDTVQTFETMVAGIGRGNARLIKTLGIDIPDRFKKTFDSMDLTSQKQLLLNTVLSAGSQYVAKYGEDTLSAADKIKQYNAENQNLKDELGTALLPILIQVQQGLMPLVKGFTALAQSNPQLIQTFVGVVGALAAGAIGLGVLSKAAMIGQVMFANLTATITTTQLALGVLGIAFIAIASLLASTYSEEVAAQQKTMDLNNAFGDLGDTGTGAIGAINGGLDSTNSKLADMRQAIQDENDAFEEQIQTIMRTRKDDLANNKASLEQQEKDFKNKMKELEKTYEEKTKSQKEQNEQRLADLETSFGQMVLVGSNTYDQDVANYKDAIEKQKQENEDKLQTIVDQHTQEVDDAKSAYEETTNKLIEKINEDEAFLQKHAEFQYALNDSVSKDEIEKLQATHEKRLAMINKQYSAEAGMFGNMTGDMGSNWDALINHVSHTNLADAINIDFGVVLSKTWDKIKSFGKQIMAGLGAILVEASRDIAHGVINAIKSIPLIGDKLAGSVDVDSMIDQMADEFNSNLANWANVGNGMPQFATGVSNFSGGWAMVGERGPELINLPQGSNVIPNNEISNVTNSSNQTVNNYNNFYVDRSVDYDAFQLRLNRSLKIN